MSHYFIPEDFEALNHKIDALKVEFRRIGGEMGKSCEEGAETFHDNFAYEDGERQLYMLSRRLREMVQIRNNAQIVKPAPGARRVGIGREVTIADLDTGEARTIRIGSYMVLCSDEAVSYKAPLARLLVGAQQGDVREGRIGGRRRSFEVLRVR